MKEIPVTFKSGKRQLIGILHLPKRKKAPVVIMCHGYGGDKLGNNRRTFAKAARYFSKKGVATLRFDFLGCGDSEGEFEELTVTKQIKNLEDAISFLENIKEIDKYRIGAIGWSRGSAVCILAAAKDRRIKCVVDWAGEADFKDQWAPHLVKEAQKRGKFSFYWDTVITKKSVEDERHYNILRAIKKMKKPFLVIHGTNDENVSLNQGETLYKAAKKPKKLFVVKKANHSFSGFEERVINETFRWLKRWL